MSSWYLLVDDDSYRVDNEYRPFANRYRPQGLSVYPARSPRAAIDLLAQPQRQPGLAGALVDFELGGRRRDRTQVRIEVRGPDGVDYPISTGIGVLDWISAHEPGLPVWAVTDIAAVHAPIYLTSANLWFGARPLTIDRFTTSHDVTDRLFAELSQPDLAENLNPAWSQITSASTHFESLLNRSLADVEATEWMRALASVPSGLGGGFAKALGKAIVNVVGRPVRVGTEELATAMAHWQHELAQTLGTFSVRVDWPDVSGAVNLSPWGDVNPFADFLGKNSECVEFLESLDVQRAFRRWRDTHPLC